MADEKKFSQVCRQTRTEAFGPAMVLPVECNSAVVVVVVVAGASAWGNEDVLRRPTGREILAVAEIQKYSEELLQIQAAQNLPIVPDLSAELHPWLTLKGAGVVDNKSSVAGSLGSLQQRVFAPSMATNHSVF